MSKEYHTYSTLGGGGAVSMYFAISLPYTTSRFLDVRPEASDRMGKGCMNQMVFLVCNSNVSGDSFEWPIVKRVVSIDWRKNEKATTIIREV